MYKEVYKEVREQNSNGDDPLKFLYICPFKNNSDLKLIPTKVLTQIKDAIAQLKMYWRLYNYHN